MLNMPQEEAREAHRKWWYARIESSVLKLLVVLLIIIVVSLVGCPYATQHQQKIAETVAASNNRILYERVLLKVYSDSVNRESRAKTIERVGGALRAYPNFSGKDTIK